MNFKFEVRREDIGDMQPALYILLGAYLNFCTINKVPCLITSLKHDSVVGRKSLTHSTGRAFDISIRGWPTEKVKEFEIMMNRDYAHIAAISASDLKPRAVVVHEVINPETGKSQGLHAHVQVKPQ